MEKVIDIMSRDAAFCEPATPVIEVAKMMRDIDCGEIPVVESREYPKPIGVVTDRDIVCRLVAEGKNPLVLKARDCMSSPCITVGPETSVEDCCHLLEEHRIRRAPVVDEAGLCIGIVSQADIALKSGADHSAELLQEVSRVS